MAHARRRVDTLNDAMQARLIGDRDPADEMVIRWDDDGGGERTVGVGDRIRTRRNDYALVTTAGMTVVNGATWQVARIDEGGLWVRSADRGSVYLPASYLEARDEDTGRPHVELGYASTVHSAQGRTVDQAVIVVGARTEAELLYVGMTRGRTSNIAVSDSSGEDGRTRFLTALANPSAETVAALDLVAEGRARAARVAAAKAERERAAQERRRQAERAEREARERADAPQLVEDLAGMDPEDARSVLYQELSGGRWLRPALAALSEQHKREREAARAEAEKEALEQVEKERVERERAEREANAARAETERAAAERWQLEELWKKDLADRAKRREEWEKARKEWDQLTQRRQQLGAAVVSHDKAQAKLGPIAKRRGVKERAEERSGLTDQITKVKERQETLRQVDAAYQDWKATRAARWKEATTLAEGLEAGLSNHERCRLIAAELGISTQAAYAVVRYGQIEDAREGAGPGARAGPSPAGTASRRSWLRRPRPLARPARFRLKRWRNSDSNETSLGRASSFNEGRNVGLVPVC